MNELRETTEFASWMAALGDLRARARIAVRVERARQGNFGDCDPVGEGVLEMRIHYGPGYRVYFARRGNAVYFLLYGGDKSTQSRDILRAKLIWRQVKRPSHD